jgi:ATP adenylyltransferase
MNLDRLWAGWRAAYVESVPTPTEGVSEAEFGIVEDETCVFCRILADPSPDSERGVINESDLSVAMINAYPYTPGHILVMPRRHVQDLGDLTTEEAGDLWRVALDGVAAIERAYAPDGMNLGANLGRAAGAGIPRHVHLHVVPRWTGDTNFMTTVASVRVLPEPLPQSWEKLHAAWMT